MILLGVASAGNILGSCVNYGLGRFLAGSDRLERLVPHSRRARVEQWYRRYGKWSLLMSWVPLVGDPLTVVAGALREPLRTFLTIVSVAKAGRYLALMALHQAWMG